MASSNDTLDILGKNGVIVSNIVSEQSRDILCIKRQPGGANRYITVPLGESSLTTSVFKAIMDEAGIPLSEYQHLV